MKILVPDIVTFETREADVEVVHFNPAVAIPEEHIDAEALVVWGFPSNKLLVDAARRMTSLRWVQLLSAGSDAAITAGFSRDVILASGRSLHDAPVAEHALCLVLAAARRLHVLSRAQIGHRWATEVGGIQPEPSPGVFSTLRGAQVTIWGFGSIAASLAPHLVALGAHVTGVASSARTVGEIDVVAAADVDRLLPTTDVLILILPLTPNTRNVLNAGRIDLLPRHAWVVNVGRGATIDEAALTIALRDGALGGAALDVVAEEPLATSSPLWDLSNVIITPHAAGGRPLGASDLIARNLALLKSGAKLENTIER